VIEQLNKTPTRISLLELLINSEPHRALSYPNFARGSLLMACNLCLTTSRYLAPIVAKYVKFRNVPEVKREHCCTIREVP